MGAGKRRLLGGVAVSGLAAVGATTSGEVLATSVPFSTAQFLAHWWVFPASVVFSFVALAAGVSGALFFSPFFMLVVGLSPAQAIGAGLLTEVAGMGNGLRAYVKQGVVDYATAKWLLAGSIPAIVVGALLAHRVDPTILKLVFGAGLLVLGGFLVFYPAPEDCEPGEKAGFEDETGPETVIEAADGERFRYRTCWRAPGVGLSSIGGFVTGLISAGLPEIVTTQLIIHCRLPPRVAIATSVFVLAITAVVGAAIHALSATPVWYVVAWSVPGVLVGGTVGSRAGKFLPADRMETGLGVVFGAVGVVVLAVELMA